MGRRKWDERHKADGPFKDIADVRLRMVKSKKIGDWIVCGPCERALKRHAEGVKA